MVPIGDLAPRARRGRITLLLVITSLVVFFGLQLSGDACDQQVFLYRWSAIPHEILTGDALTGAELDGVLGACRATADKHVALSVLTAAFLHGSVAHLAGNLVFLLVFGDAVEARLGPLRFVGLVVLGALAATLTHAVTHPASTTPLAGASGIVAAVLGVSLVSFPRRRILTLVPFPVWILTAVVPGLRTVRNLLVLAVVSIPAWLLLAGWFVLQLSAVGGSTTDETIAYEAHVGGFVAGVAFVVVAGRRRRHRSAGQ